jgi:hypothetical protein
MHTDQAAKVARITSDNLFQIVTKGRRAPFKLADGTSYLVTQVPLSFKKLQTASVTDLRLMLAAQAAEVSRIISDNLFQIAMKARALQTPDIVPELADVTAYLIDTCATLAALLAALPVAAPIFLKASEDRLLLCLAHVHDSLVPAAAAAARVAPPSHARDLVLGRVDRVRLAVARGAYLLLVHGILEVGSHTGGQANGAAAHDTAETLIRLLIALQARSPVPC